MDKRRFCTETIFVILFIFFLRTVVSGEVYDDDDDEGGSWNRCPWIRNKLKNGRVKIRSRGRIAKFLCEPGYELAGKRFATCVKGQWNNPIPVCVSRGCHRPPHVDNGRVTLMYRGAVQMYDCLPGYTLEGGASIYCDGRRWSSEPPTCTVATTDPQTSCDFEDPDLCGWSHDPTHDFDWKRNQFSTPSGHAGTGPSFDHTFGEGKGGFYMFMEASAPRAINDTARLFSPVYPAAYSGGCFVFWYHMFGSTTGGLKVYVRPESQVFGELPATWVTFGDQGNQWYRGNVSIPQFSESFQIIIEGIRGSSYIGDTAIDDVSINTVDCENVGNLTDNTFGITSDSCRGRCRESDNSSVCGCNDDCVESGICCEDFMSICTKSDGDDNKDEQPFGRTTIVTTILDISETDAELTTIETSAKDESSDSVSSSVAPVSQATFVSSSISTRTSEKESEKHDDLAVTATEIITSLETDFPNSSKRITEATSPISLSNISTTVPGTSSIPSALSSSSTSSTTTITSTTKSTTTPTVTSTTKSTTTPTVTFTTKSTTTPSITSTQSTTTKSIMFSSFSTLLSSASIDEKQTSTSSSVSTNPSTTVATTISEFQTELPETQSTRKTYNLRPRTRTTTMRTSSTKEISTLNTPLLLSTLAYESTSLRSSSAGVSSTTETPIPTRVTNSHYIRPTKMTSIVPTVWFHPQISMISSPIRIVTTTTKSASILRKTTKKFTPFDPRIKPTEMSKFDTEAHAAKTSSSDDRQPVITIISVIIVIIICAAAGLVFFIKRWKVKKLSKIEDDSEMRFLSENEVVEYSDSSALDRINFNP